LGFSSGKTRAREDRFEEAYLLYEQAAREPESEEEALRRHGQLLVERGQFGKAVDLLEQALVLRPDPSLSAYLDSVRSLAK
jgi:tetratricopeptide (TPR) repeat protein